MKIDGSKGEGGGQILRTSLSLSMLKGEALHMTNIRAGRRKPGLMRQHLAAVKAAAKMCKAKVEGAQLGSTELSFEPTQTFEGGDLRVELSTAGSTGLIFQTLLPTMLSISQPSCLFLKGGTHNPMAPCYDFLKESFIPCLSKMGFQVELKLNKRGFYPAGGGEMEVRVNPSTQSYVFHKTQRDALQEQEAYCLVSKMWPGVALKEKQLLEFELGPEIPIKILEDKDTDGPGNVLLLKQHYGEFTSVFSSFGERGRSSEKVVQQLKEEALSFQNSKASIEVRLADQLLLPMILAKGGSFTTSRLSNHLKTQQSLLNEVLGEKVEREELDGVYLFKVH